MQVMVRVVVEEEIQKAKQPENISLTSALRTGILEQTG